MSNPESRLAQQSASFHQQPYVWDARYLEVVEIVSEDQFHFLVEIPSLKRGAPHSYSPKPKHKLGFSSTGYTLDFDLRNLWGNFSGSEQCFDGALTMAFSNPAHIMVLLLNLAAISFPVHAFAAEHAKMSHRTDAGELD